MRVPRLRRRRWGVLLVLGLFFAGLLVISYAATRPKPPIGGRYGAAIGMDTLANTVIGGPSAIEAAYRFRAAATAPLSEARFYLQAGDGYAAGSLGELEVAIHTDGPGHAPSGVVIAAETFTPAEGAGESIAFDPAPQVTAGELYHLVFRNVAQDPIDNYISVNGVFMWEPTTPRQPRFSDLDWGQLTRSSDHGWEELDDLVPILGLTYGDGTRSGLGYMEVWVHSHRSIGGSAKAREAIAVKEIGRIVTSFSVRLMRLYGESPLVVTLERGDGQLLEEGTIPASMIPVGVPGAHEPSDRTEHAAWTTLSFATPHTLAAGDSFNVTLSAADDTRYSIFVIRKGSEYGYPPWTWFAEGRAQYSGDGQTWTPFSQDGGGLLDQGDLQFYFD